MKITDYSVPLAVLIVLLITSVFIFSDTKIKHIFSGTSPMITQKTSETQLVLWDKRDVKITLELDSDKYSVLILDKSNELTIPIEGMVSPQVGFVNDKFIGLYFHTEASDGFIVEADLVNRQTQEVTAIASRTDSRILAMQHGGDSVLTYQIPLKEVRLVDFGYDVISTHKYNSVQGHFPHHAEFSPDDRFAAIYESMPLGGEYPEHQFSVFVLNMETGDLTLVHSSAKESNKILWTSNSVFELWGQVGANEERVATYGLIDGVWEEK